MCVHVCMYTVEVYMHVSACAQPVIEWNRSRAGPMSAVHIRN